VARENLGSKNGETCRLAELVIEIEQAAPNPDVDWLAQAASLLELHVGKTATGKYDREALICLQRAIPRAAIVLAEVALAVLARDGMQHDQYARASALAEQALRLSASPHAKQFDVLALASLRLGKHHEAVALARKAIDLAKTDAERAAFRERLRACEQAASAR
jgi:tetratricopeptide (TPR) repeat protein